MGKEPAVTWLRFTLPLFLPLFLPSLPPSDSIEDAGSKVSIRPPRAGARAAHYQPSLACDRCGQASSATNLLYNLQVYQRLDLDLGDAL
jgi:hypothetical protein